MSSRTAREVPPNLFSTTGSFVRCVAIAVVAIGCGGCAVSSTFVRGDIAAQPSAAQPPDSLLDTRLLLIGDAGEPRLPVEPVLVALRAEAALDPERTWIVFLGDNIYPHGMPPESAADRAEAERRLRAEIEAATASGARTVFVPGNHEYALDGWAGLRREEEFIAAQHEPRLRALPAGGCPGPDTLDVGARVRIVALDSQWWFQGPPKPMHPSSPCPCDRADEITAALDRALATAGPRRVLVVAHHPIASRGPHGGFFPWQDHVFPLRNVARWLYLPLPIVGSLYPLSRSWGITEQDFSHGHYEALRQALGRSFAAHPGVIYAAGHDHGLQLLDVAGSCFQIVSGAGSVSRPDPVGTCANTLLASARAGFVRVDVWRDGSAWVQMIEVSPDGHQSRPHALALPPPLGQSQR